MNLEGIITAVLCFACIGLFHPIVIRAEYHWSARCWPFFLLAGLVFLGCSLLVDNSIGASALGAAGVQLSLEHLGAEAAGKTGG